MSTLSEEEEKKRIDEINKLEQKIKELNKLRAQHDLEGYNNGYGNNSEIERLEKEIKEMQNKLGGKSWLQWLLGGPPSSGGRRYKKKRSTKRKKSAKRRTRRS